MLPIYSTESPAISSSSPIKTRKSHSLSTKKRSARLRESKLSNRIYKYCPHRKLIWQTNSCNLQSLTLTKSLKIKLVQVLYPRNSSQELAPKLNESPSKLPKQPNLSPLPHPLLSTQPYLILTSSITEPMRKQTKELIKKASSPTPQT